MMGRKWMNPYCYGASVSFPIHRSQVTKVLAIKALASVHTWRSEPGVGRSLALESPRLTALAAHKEPPPVPLNILELRLRAGYARCEWTRNAP
jgi:hypothetical protein